MKLKSDERTDGGKQLKLYDVCKLYSHHKTDVKRGNGRGFAFTNQALVSAVVKKTFSSLNKKSRVKLTILICHNCLLASLKPHLKRATKTNFSGEKKTNKQLKKTRK